MGGGFGYAAVPGRASHNPMRAFPLIAPVAPMLHRMAQLAAAAATPAPVPAAPRPVVVRPLDAHQLPLPRAEAAVRNAQAHLMEMLRCYDAARRQIGEANRGISNGIKLENPSRERMRQVRSRVFRLFNRRRAQVAQARKRLAAAQDAVAALIAAAE